MSRPDPDLDELLAEHTAFDTGTDAEDCPEDCECPTCIYDRMHNIYEARS